MDEKQILFNRIYALQLEYIDFETKSILEDPQTWEYVEELIQSTNCESGIQMLFDASVMYKIGRFSAALLLIHHAIKNVQRLSLVVPTGEAA